MKYKILIILVLLVVVWIIWNRAKGKVTDTTKRIIHGTQGEDLNQKISTNRKSQLEGFAEEIYKSIYSWTESNRAQDLKFRKITHLPDNEFKYVVDYYNLFMGKNTLYYDVDWELNPYEGDDLILARIEKMNLKK